MSATLDQVLNHAPVAVVQEPLWFQSRLAADRITYNEVISIRKDGELDLGALRSAFNEIIRRHEAWRTTFEVRDGQPVQVVRDAPGFDLPLLDLSFLERARAQRRAVELVAEAARVPYDLSRGPLLRPRLIRFTPDHHRLYLALHHIIFDGVAVYRVVLEELVALYEAFRAGRPSPLPEPQAQYGDYARWEQQWIDLPRVTRRLDRWRQHLAPGAASSVALDHPRRASPRFRGGVCPVTVPPETVTALRRAGQAAGATLFQALAATWAMLLGRYAGAREVVFATAVDMRQRPEFQKVVGCCMTTLPLRISLDGDPSFGELVGRVRNELLDGLDNLIPFERLVRELAPQGEPGANPIYQTMIVLEPPLDTAQHGWSIHQMEGEIGAAVGATKVDLELELDERPSGELSGRLIYDRDLFDASTAARCAAYWSSLVAAVAEEPAAPVELASADGQSTEEEQPQLMDWNATEVEDLGGLVPEYLGGRADRQANATAVTDECRSIGYGELDRRSEEVAARLRAGGNGGRVVDLPAEPGVELFVDALGAVKAGRIPRVGAAVAGRGATCGLLRALAEAVGIGAQDVVLSVEETLLHAPAVELWLGLVAGARIVVAPGGIERDGAAVSRLIRREGISFLHAAPHTWQALIDSGLKPARGLKALCGGGGLSPELASEILQRCRLLWNAYGTDRTPAHVTAGRVERPESARIVGRPLAGVRAHVVDRGGRPVPIGAVGELVLGGAAVPEDDLTGDIGADRCEGPFGSGPALCTGDSGRWRSDGRLELVPAQPTAGEPAEGSRKAAIASAANSGS